MTLSSCSSALLVSIILVVGVILSKCPSQSWCSGTFKKSHACSPASASASLPLMSSSVAMLLSLLPSHSTHPMNDDNSDRGHWHRHGCRTPHSHRRGARQRCDDRAVEDSVCQAEEGVVQVASGVGTVTLSRPKEHWYQCCIHKLIMG